MEIHEIARLARLRLTGEEARAFEGEMTAMLALADSLAEAAPAMEEGLPSCLRADEPAPAREQGLAFTAPAMEGMA